jgi:hypothetical protein
MLRLGAALFLTSLAPLALHAQDSTASPRGQWHIGITYHDYGVTIGNAARTNGLRINFQDAELERVNGVNVTIWKPVEPLSGTVNGVALGLAGPAAEYLNGIAVGVGGVVAERRARWRTAA